MDQIITLNIVLEKPPAGVDFCLQKGKGNDYERVQKQRSGSKDLQFKFQVVVRKNKNNQADFYGPFVQGPAGERFIYIDIGVCAGQFDSIWNRRLKVPLNGMSQTAIDRAANNSQLFFEAHVNGTAKDGGPNCATVKPFAGWHLI